MAILGWIGLGLVTAMLATGLRRSGESRVVIAGRCTAGMTGAVAAGFVAIAAGVGAIGDFFHFGTWLIALGGAVLVLLVYELARSSRGFREPPDPQSWAVRRAGGESERLHRNW